MPENLYCIVDKSTYIWDKSIVHKCEFTRVKEVLLRFENDFAIGKNLLFKIVNRENYYETNMFSTTEGLYLTEYNKKSKWPDSLIDVTVEHEVMLADLDAKSYNIFKILSKISDKINLKACQTWQTQLNEFTCWHNEFIKIEDSENKNIIIFNDNGILTLPKCEIVKTIYFRIEDVCRKDVAVHFEINKIKINGYLSNYNILRTDSGIENCDVGKKIYVENMILEKKGRKISILNSTYKKLTFNKIYFQPNQVLLEHELKLETKFDFVKEIHWLLNDHGIELVDIEIKENKQDESEIIRIITQIYQFIKKMKIWFILMLVSTIITTIMIVMIRFSLRIRETTRIIFDYTWFSVDFLFKNCTVTEVRCVTCYKKVFVEIW